MKSFWTTLQAVIVVIHCRMLSIILSMILVSMHLSTSCEHYLATSLIPNAGLGIFVGEEYTSGSLLAPGYTLIIPSQDIYDWQLNNYIYSCDHSNHSMIVFGIAMMLNHKVIPNADNLWTDDVHPIDISAQEYFPYSIYRRQSYVSSYQLLVGDEVYAYYGNEKWFIDIHLNLYLPQSPWNIFKQMEYV
jgi:hypothetical protein